MPKDAPRQGQKDKPGHIKRSPNPFILFLSDFAKNRPPNHQPFGPAAGEAWKALSEADKSAYREKARIAKAEHKKKYPEYVFKPIRRKAPKEQINDEKAAPSRTQNVRRPSPSDPPPPEGLNNDSASLTGALYQGVPLSTFFRGMSAEHPQVNSALCELPSFPPAPCYVLQAIQPQPSNVTSVRPTPNHELGKRASSRPAPDATRSPRAGRPSAQTLAPPPRVHLRNYSWTSSCSGHESTYSDSGSIVGSVHQDRGSSYNDVAPASSCASLTSTWNPQVHDNAGAFNSSPTPSHSLYEGFGFLPSSSQPHFGPSYQIETLLSTPSSHPTLQFDNGRLSESGSSYQPRDASSPYSNCPLEDFGANPAIYSSSLAGPLFGDPAAPTINFDHHDFGQIPETIEGLGFLHFLDEGSSSSGNQLSGCELSKS